MPFLQFYFFFFGGGGGGGVEGREKARGRKGLKVYWISSTFSAMFEKGGNYFLGWGGGGGGRSIRCIGLAPHFLPCLKRGAITSWDGGGGGGGGRSIRCIGLAPHFLPCLKRGAIISYLLCWTRKASKKGSTLKQSRWSIFNHFFNVFD